MELARVFLKLGATAFGGPAAHLALMREEIVTRRRWLTEQEFLDLIGAANLIPGPNSTEVAIHVGYARGGWRGLLVAGGCFIAPAALIVLALAWAYVRFGALPETRAVLDGLQPVVIAVVALALAGLARTAVQSATLAALGVAALVAVALGAHEILVLAACGATSLALRRPRSLGAAWVVPVSGAISASGAAPAAVALAPLFFVFLKAGALLFGSGYVLLAFLRADLVERLGWLTEAQLLDAIAVGQVTPGPVFTTATFVGYVLAGAPGALVATLGIFLPAFVYVAATAPVLPRLRRSAAAAAILDGVNVGALALMAAVTWHLGRAALTGPFPIAVAVVSAAILATTRVNSAWLLLAGAVLGLLAA